MASAGGVKSKNHIRMLNIDQHSVGWDTELSTEYQGIKIIGFQSQGKFLNKREKINIEADAVGEYPLHYFIICFARSNCH